MTDGIGACAETLSLMTTNEFKNYEIDICIYRKIANVTRDIYNLFTIYQFLYLFHSTG